MPFVFRAVAAAAWCGLVASASLAQADPAPAPTTVSKEAPKTLQSIIDWRRAQIGRGGSAAPAPRGAPPPPYIYHSSVNDPAQDSAAELSGAGVSQFNASLLDLGGGNLVAAFDDSNLFTGGTDSQFTGYAYSSNNGFSWTDASGLPAVPAGDLGYPSLASHQASGTVYIASSSLAVTNELTVRKSGDFGRTFTSPVNALPDISTSDSVGAFKIVVDNFGGAGSGNGNVYACGAISDGTTSRVVFTRSIDGASSFGPSGGVVLATNAATCSIVVSPNHQITAFYLRLDDTGSYRIFSRRSRDRGLTFAGEILVANLTEVSGQINLNGGSLVATAPFAAVNPVGARPYLYVVYTDLDPVSASARSQIYYVRSTDAGLTWSAPVRVNDDNPGEQYLPAIGFASGGEQVMFSYNSRSQDPGNLAVHRRARLGALTPAGGITLNPSFQIGPNTPSTSPVDAFGETYVGEYTAITGGTGALSALWMDNRASRGTTPQPDVYFARIAVPPASADLSVTTSVSPASIDRGDEAVITVTAQALSGTANDVFVSTSPAAGLVIRSISTATGKCWSSAVGVGCSLGAIAAGGSKTVRIVAAAPTAGTVSATVTGSTSSVDTNPSNNSAAASLTVSSAGVANSNHSSGPIAVAIPDGAGFVEVPLEVGSVGNFVSAIARVRIDHTWVSDLRIELAAPTGEVIALSSRNGGDGDGYGSGPNDCTGTFTTFRDDVATSITTGAAPFAGNFKPQQPLGTLFGVPTEGRWKLRVTDVIEADEGTIGCVQLTITRKP